MSGNGRSSRPSWLAKQVRPKPKVPAAPTGLTAAAGSASRIDLAWADNSGNETGFIVERSPDGATGWVVVAAPAAGVTSCSDAGLAASTAYAYRVRAVNSVGSSAASNTATATTLTALTIPAAPSGLTATAGSASRIDLAWADNSGNETGFIVERSPDGATGWVVVAAPAAGVTSCSDAGLAASTAYAYRVRAVNSVGSSAASNTATATTPAALTTPAAPTGLTAAAGSASRIDLAWADNSGNETGFVVERSPNGTTGWVAVAAPASNTASYSDAGLAASTAYSYRVKAVNAAGGSAYSNTATATTLAVSSGNSATFLGSDLTTSGNWKSAYGGDGYLVVDDATSLPSYASVTASGYTDYILATSTSDPTALQKAAIGSTDRIAACWYSGTSFSIEINITDGSSHDLAVYAQDIGNNGRSQRIEVLDAVSNAVLDSQTIDSFGNGVYLRWTILGHVKLRVTNVSGANAVLGGLFFGGPFVALAPAAPSGLVAAPVSASRIKLDWTDNSKNESGFLLERSPDDGAGNPTGAWTQAATPAADQATYTDTGLVAATRYLYRIKATNAVGDSAYSNTAGATTPALPAAPSGLSATPVSASGIDLAWTNNSTDDVSFLLERSPDDGAGNPTGAWTAVTTPLPNAVHYSDTSLAASTTYHYRVKAANEAGDSAYSNTATATTEAVGQPVPLTSVALANTVGSATPSTTYLAFGHPFVKGDVPAGYRVRATFTPAGGPESAPLPVQEEGVVTWTDSSRKFLRAMVALPSVAANETGTLTLYSEHGAPQASLPNGKTDADIAADLRANFPFTVTARNLIRGRERINIVAAGSGYAPNTTLSISGGTPDQGDIGTYTVINGGAFYYASTKVPPQHYTVAPTVTINDPGGQGTGAVLSFYNPPVDGSGSWTWRANDQLALLGSTDARGRTRCEVIESGPLCVTFHVWGPFADDSGGAEHPHLVIRAWYRCWLKPTDGTIDRVEHLHSVEQGWIEDLAGGSTPAEVQVGDFAVQVGGAPVANRTFNGIRIPHHTMHPLSLVDGTANESNVITGGSDWTSGSPTLLPRFTNTYWRKSAVMPPYDVDYYAANPIQPPTEPSPAPYHPGARRPNGKFEVGGFGNMNLNSGGEGDMLGLIPQWSVRAYHSQDLSYLRSDMATSLMIGQMPMHIRDPRTGRMPSLVPQSVFNSVTAGLGDDRSASTYYHAPNPGGGQCSTDIAFYSPPDGDYASGVGDTTNNEGGWYVSGDGWSTAHWPSPCYYPYLRTGAPWFLEPIKLHANQILMSRVVGTELQNGANAGSRNLVLPDGSLLQGRFIVERGVAQERVEGWSWKLLGQALAVLPDTAIEKPYFQTVYDQNDAAVVTVINTSSANFKALGCWDFPLGGIIPGLRLKYLQPWMQQYLNLSRAWAYLALDRPANSLTFLQHHKKMFKDMYGGGPFNTCGWTCSMYSTFAGPSVIGSDYFDSWDKAPQVPLQQVMFDSVGWVLATPGADLTNHIGGRDLNHAVDEAGNGIGIPFSDGDRVLFHEFSGDAAGDSSFGPPATGTTQGGATVSLAKYQWYYVTQLDAVNRRFRISPNADGTDPFVSFSASQFSGMGLRYSSCPTPVYGNLSASNRYVFSNRAADTEADFGLAMSQMVSYISVICGLASVDEHWVQEMDARLAAARTYFNWAGNQVDWVDRPKHKFQSNL